MSRAVEERYEKHFVLVLAQAKKDFVVGAKVYRPGYDKVEEGLVTKVAPCRLDARGDPVEDPNGDHTLFYAQFEPGGPWMSQTYPWRFFARAEPARARLVQKLIDRIYSHNTEVEALKQTIESLKKLGTEYPRELAG